MCVIWAEADYDDCKDLKEKQGRNDYKGKRAAETKKNTISSIKSYKNQWKSATTHKQDTNRNKANDEKEKKLTTSLKLKHLMKFMCSNTGPNADIIIKWLLWRVVVGCVHCSFIVFSLRRVLFFEFCVCVFFHHSMWTRKKSTERTGSSMQYEFTT